jgi:hypothetical protein
MHLNCRVWYHPILNSSNAFFQLFDELHAYTRLEGSGGGYKFSDMLHLWLQLVAWSDLPVVSNSRSIHPLAEPSTHAHSRTLIWMICSLLTYLVVGVDLV